MGLPLSCLCAWISGGDDIVLDDSTGHHRNRWRRRGLNMDWISRATGYKKATGEKVTAIAHIVVMGLGVWDSRLE